MILTMDIGNTNIKCAAFDGELMLAYWRISTNRDMSSDEYGMLMLNLLDHYGVDVKQIDGVIVSSVVPTVNFTIDHMCRNYIGHAPMVVAPGIKTGINIKYDSPSGLGSDRIANAVGAYEIYGGPCIYIDFGTATTFGVVSAKGEFLGGAICPGIKLSSEALVSSTSKLPKFELIKPSEVINRNTIGNMQSGLLYGHIGMVKYLIKRMREEIGAPGAKVIATGGMSSLIATDTGIIDEINALLTLKGLYFLYKKNYI